MNIRSREVVLGLAVVGLLSQAACTAEKTGMKSPEISSLPESTPTKRRDGVFTAHDQLKPVYFELNQSMLSEKEMRIVMKNAEWLMSQPPYLVKVVGFTDSRGSMKKNERLGLLRARTVSDSYIALGIPKDRIMMSSLIEEQPACEPLTDECLSQSRRSETMIEESCSQGTKWTES